MSIIEMWRWRRTRRRIVEAAHELKVQTQEKAFIEALARARAAYEGNRAAEYYFWAEVVAQIGSERRSRAILEEAVTRFRQEQRQQSNQPATAQRIFMAQVKNVRAANQESR